MSGHCIVAFLRKTRCDSFSSVPALTTTVFKWASHRMDLRLPLGGHESRIAPHQCSSLSSACHPYNCPFFRLLGALLAAVAVNFSSQGGFLINQPFCLLYDSSFLQLQLLILLSFTIRVITSHYLSSSSQLTMNLISVSLCLVFLFTLVR